MRKDGTVLHTVDHFQQQEISKELERLIIDRKSNVQHSIEVFHSHPILEAGLSLVDAPGTGETENITELVHDFLERNTFVTSVYMYDGRKGIRHSVSY